MSPKYLFRLDCFTRILTTEQEDILRDNIEYLPDTESGKGSVEEEGPQVFLLSGYGEPGSADTEEDDTDSDVASRRREWTCWVTAHRPKQKPWEKTHDRGRPVPAPDLIILEFELERDPYNPLMQNFEPVVLRVVRTHLILEVRPPKALDLPRSDREVPVRRGIHRNLSPLLAQHLDQDLAVRSDRILRLP